MHRFFHIVSLIVFKPDSPIEQMIPARGDTFKSTVFDLNEDVWVQCGFDWFTLRNRTATDIGNDRYVLSAYHPATYEAYVAIVQMIETVQ